MSSDLNKIVGKRIEKVKPSEIDDVSDSFDIEIVIVFDDGSQLLIYPECSFCDDMWIEYSFKEKNE